MRPILPFVVVIVISLFYLALVGYFFVLEWKMRRRIRKIATNPELPVPLAERRIKEVRKWGSSMRLGLTKTNFILVPTNVMLVLVTMATFYGSSQAALEANRINREVAELEYFNAQPFLTLGGGSADGTRTKVRNIGGGPAKDIFFIKHYIDADGADAYVLTRDGDVELVLASGQEVEINLSERVMDRFESKDDVLVKLSCPAAEFFLDEARWVAALYRNVRGEHLVSKFQLPASPRPGRSSARLAGIRATTALSNHR